MELMQYINGVLPMFQLADTVREAANQGAAVPQSLEEMRGLCQEGITSLMRKAGACYPDEMMASFPKLQELAEAIADAGAEKLPALVDAWEGVFSSPLLQPYVKILKQTNQFSEGEAESAVAFVRQLTVISAKTRGNLLMETAFKCQASAPQLSWETMMEAMETAPDLFASNQNAHLHGYVYQPGAHPQSEFLGCPICDSEESVPYRAACSCLITSFKPIFLPAKLWMKCSRCGNLYTRFFPTEFLAMSDAPPRQLTPRPEGMVMQPASSITLHIWGEILKKLSSLTDGRDLLEVGVGKGEMISVAQELGFQITAVELVGEIAQHVSDVLDIPVIQADFLKLPEDRQYSIITMRDILEHLQAPVQGLKKAYALLRDDGVLWLSTPNFKSSFSRLMKVNDPMWREPEHITYFNKDGLLKILEKTGFLLEEYTVSNRYNGSMELILRKKGHKPEAAKE